MVETSLRDLLMLMERQDVMDMACQRCCLGLVSHANQLRRVCTACVHHYAAEEFASVPSSSINQELNALMLRMAEELGFVSRPGG